MFLTFSHADEAKAMLMEYGGGLVLMDHAELSFDLKSRLDHSDMDMEYFVKRAKNHA